MTWELVVFLSGGFIVGTLLWVSVSEDVVWIETPIWWLTISGPVMLFSLFIWWLVR